MTLMERRRALIATQETEPPIPPNKFVEGSYTRGDSAWTVDSSGNVIMSALSGTSSDQRAAILMVRKIDFAVGDTIRVVAKKISGSLSLDQYCDVWVCGFKIVSNQLWKKSTTALDVSATASSASSLAYFTMSNRSRTATFSSYKFKVEVYVNGTKAFPEV